MTAAIFYILAGITVSATAMAITRREMVHAIVYLIISFFGLALIFFMMGAPLIAVLEVLIYAGAIMVLFLFIVMMLDMGVQTNRRRPFWLEWGPAAGLAAVMLACTVVMFVVSPDSGQIAGATFISPRTFGQALFTKYALAVEAVSLLLLFALVGSLYLGRRD